MEPMLEPGALREGFGTQWGGLEGVKGSCVLLQAGRDLDET